MKYWVYKDSQILGPLSKEDFALAGGVRPETLVCPEGGPGNKDLDWRCAEDVGELSSLCLGRALLPGAEMPPATEFGIMERLQFEVMSMPVEPGGWLEDLFSVPARIPADDLPKRDESAVEELKSAQKRITELTAQLEGLSRRIAELETAPQEAPSPEGSRSPLPKGTLAAAPIAAAPLPPAPPAPPEPARVQEDEGAPVPPEMPPVLQPLPEVEVPETLKPPEQAGPALGKDESPYRWEDQPVLQGGLPVAGSSPPPSQAPLAPAEHPEIPPAPKGRLRRVVKVSAPQSLKKVTRASEPGAPPAPKAPSPGASAPAQPPALQPPVIQAPALKPAENPYEWGPQPTPGEALPAAGSAPAPMELSAPPATVVPSFSPSLSPPPQPFLSPPPAAAAAMPSLEAPPVPTLTPAMPTPAAPPPMTMAFSAGAEIAPPPAGLAVLPAPGAGPSTAQVLAKLAKPEPAKTEPPKAPPKSRGRTFIIVIALATVVVAFAGWFLLFRDSSGLKSAMQMDSGRPPVGAEVPELPVPAQPEPQAQPAPQPEPAPPMTANALPEGRQDGGAAAPPQAPVEAPRDERPAAIALVKEFPLDGDRGTVGQWLQYSFAASPGAADTEKWDAGAYEETTYAVKYTVQPTGKDAITYLFEADVARKTVKGMNEAARQMLAGSASAPRGRAIAKAKPAGTQKPKRVPPRRAAPPPPPKEVPLLPLPSDEELAPPADEENAFRSDTVQSNP